MAAFTSTGTAVATSSPIVMIAGRLLAAGPQLLMALERVANVDRTWARRAHGIALNAVESFREREAMVLVDWNPSTPAPRLRIVGVAI